MTIDDGASAPARHVQSEDRARIPRHQEGELRSDIAQDNPKAANRIASALLEAVERLARLPNLGRPGRVAGTRELAVPGSPYVIRTGFEATVSK